jgi:pantetheine-phosphate adenylyltransferase
MRKGRKAIYPGTFDPITNGHLDLLHRASDLFDEVILAVAESTTKDTIFTMKERLALVNKVIASNKFDVQVTVESFSGLLVDYARRKGVMTLVRGLRAISDFEYEYQMALMNRHLGPELETVFLMPDEKYVYLSSSLVRQIARLNGDLSAFLPKTVQAALEAKLR